MPAAGRCRPTCCPPPQPPSQILQLLQAPTDTAPAPLPHISHEFELAALPRHPAAQVPATPEGEPMARDMGLLGTPEVDRQTTPQPAASSKPASPKATGNPQPSRFQLAEKMKMLPAQTTPPPAALSKSRGQPRCPQAPAVLAEAPCCWTGVRQVSIELILIQAAPWQFAVYCVPDLAIMPALTADCPNIEFPISFAHAATGPGCTPTST